MTPTGHLACIPGMCPDWDWTGDPLVCRLALNLLSHTSQAYVISFLTKIFTYYNYICDNCLKNMHRTWKGHLWHMGFCPDLLSFDCKLVVAPTDILSAFKAKRLGEGASHASWICLFCLQRSHLFTSPEDVHFVLISQTWITRPSLLTKEAGKFQKIATTGLTRSWFNTQAWIHFRTEQKWASLEEV